MKTYHTSKVTRTTISAKLYKRRYPNPLQNAEAVPRGKCHKRKRSSSPRNAHNRNDTTNDNTDNLLIPTASPLDRRMRSLYIITNLIRLLYHRLQTPLLAST
ncbi:hypothetical protein FOXYSP1_21141 [Fusarium oxysporum f. sp. phaseoli]